MLQYDVSCLLLLAVVGLDREGSEEMKRPPGMTGAEHYVQATLGKAEDLADLVMLCWDAIS